MKTIRRTRGFWAALFQAIFFVAFGVLLASVSAYAGDVPSKDAKETAKAADAGLGQRNNKEVGTGEQLSFSQSEVTEEMRELEQRMFRLSEALKPLEPENSSRLLLGLKYAREELILHQMKETQDALAKLALKGAVGDQKQLLAKLERLQQLLLSTDLDFEMRLERLRQIREVLRKLDTVIKEETREEKLSKAAAEKEKEIDALAKRRAALEALVKKQTEHNEGNAPLAKQDQLNDTERDTAAKLGEKQDATRKETSALANEPVGGADPKNLSQAAENMQSAATSLGKGEAREAQPPMEKALAALKNELEETAKKEAEKREELKQEKLEEMRKDQEGNRRSTEEVTEMTRQLGSNGTAAVPELTRAAGAMSGAEGAFGNGRAGQGNGEQQKALAALKYSQELLAEEAERLAKQLRGEVKKRVMDGLTAMLEEQTAVRERTVAYGPGVKEGSRQALSGVAALAVREEKIGAIAQELINVVEETEFGIALPAALAAVRDAIDAVQVSLAEGDASDDVVAAEKQIEADLKEMLEVVSEMSDANRKNAPKGMQGEQDPRKEQARIITELRMLRLLQTRVHQNTVDTDGKRTASLTPAIRKRIEELEGRQEDIRDATERLAAERSEEVPVPQ